ncbi:MAG: hypothetical protein L6R42_004773, partial [Xanthoria sp. 1 TBL-2021]
DQNEGTKAHRPTDCRHSTTDSWSIALVIVLPASHLAAPQRTARQSPSTPNAPGARDHFDRAYTLGTNECTLHLQLESSRKRVPARWLCKLWRSTKRQERPNGQNPPPSSSPSFVVAPPTLDVPLLRLEPSPNSDCQFGNFATHPSTLVSCLGTDASSTADELLQSLPDLVPSRAPRGQHPAGVDGRVQQRKNVGNRSKPTVTDTGTSPWDH